MTSNDKSPSRGASPPISQKPAMPPHNRLAPAGALRAPQSTSTSL